LTRACFGKNTGLTLELARELKQAGAIFDQ
jgi:hypothetical protein